MLLCTAARLTMLMVACQAVIPRLPPWLVVLAGAEQKLSFDTVISNASPSALAAALKTIRQQPGRVWPVSEVSARTLGTMRAATSIGSLGIYCQNATPDALEAIVSRGQRCWQRLWVSGVGGDGDDRGSFHSSPHHGAPAGPGWPRLAPTWFATALPCSLARCTPRMVTACAGCRAQALCPLVTVSPSYPRWWHTCMRLDVALCCVVCANHQQ